MIGFFCVCSLTSLRHVKIELLRFRRNLQDQAPSNLRENDRSLGRIGRQARLPMVLTAEASWRRGWDLNPRGPEDQQLSWPILIADLEVQRPGYPGALSPYLARLPRRPRNPMLKNVLSLRPISDRPY